MMRSSVCARPGDGGNRFVGVAGLHQHHPSISAPSVRVRRHARKPDTCKNLASSKTPALLPAQEVVS